MSKKLSIFLFYLIHCLIAFVMGVTTIYLELKFFVHEFNPYIYIVLYYAFLLFCIINLCVMFFSYKLLKIEKGKRFYLTLFTNYVIVNVCSYLMFYFGLYLFIVIRLCIYGLY